MKISSGVKSKRAGAIPVRPKVKFLETATGDVTIIEMVGRDRPGLLCHLAEALRDNDLDVLSAHIEVVGAKAIDTFYVRRRGAKGELSEDMRKALSKTLRGVLELTPERRAA